MNQDVHTWPPALLPLWCDLTRFLAGSGMDTTEAAATAQRRVWAQRRALFGPRGQQSDPCQAEVRHDD